MFSLRKMSASPFVPLLEKYDFQVDENFLELHFVSRLSKSSFLKRLFSLTTILHCFLYYVVSSFWLRFHGLVFQLRVLHNRKT